MAAATSAAAAAGRRSARASTSMPSMPSVPLISARPSFSASSTGSMPPRAGRRRPGAARPSASRTSPSPISASAHGRQRGEVAGAAERAVLVHDRRDPGVEHRGVGWAVSSRTPVRPVASVESRSSISARTTSRSTSGPDPAACERIRLRCSWARRSGGMCRGGQRAEAGGRLVGKHHARSAPRDREHVGEAHRADPDGDRGRGRSHPRWRLADRRSSLADGGRACRAGGFVETMPPFHRLRLSTTTTRSAGSVSDTRPGLVRAGGGAAGGLEGRGRAGAWRPGPRR